MKSYRNAHQTAQQVAHYERDVYREGTWDSWVWETEKEFLQSCLERVQGRPVRYLDFACGTGRVMGHLANRTASATGVDISAEMLSLARERLPTATLVLADGSDDVPELEPPYDFITAFRFFQNAEPELRAEASQRLHALLANDGVLVCNVHNNTWSVSLPSTLARTALRRAIPKLSVRGLEKLLVSAGFAVYERFPTTYSSRSVFRLLGARRTRTLDRRLRALGVPPHVAVNVMLVCAKRRDDR